MTHLKIQPGPSPPSPRPLRVIAALYKAGKLAPSCQLVIITSQAGSVEWRTTQNAGAGGDYGHHMSRAACNIAGALAGGGGEGWGGGRLSLEEEVRCPRSPSHCPPATPGGGGERRRPRRRRPRDVNPPSPAVFRQVCC